ncbi:unnamed protein product, partial [Didymodactylos carnosus]
RERIGHFWTKQVFGWERQRLALRLQPTSQPSALPALIQNQEVPLKIRRQNRIVTTETF